jgi:hypothetical protein
MRGIERAFAGILLFAAVCGAAAFAHGLGRSVAPASPEVRLVAPAPQHALAPHTVQVPLYRPQPAFGAPHRAERAHRKPVAAHAAAARITRAPIAIGPVASEPAVRASVVAAKPLPKPTAPVVRREPDPPPPQATTPAPAPAAPPAAAPETRDLASTLPVTPAENDDESRPARRRHHGLGHGHGRRHDDDADGEETPAPTVDVAPPAAPAAGDDSSGDNSAHGQDSDGHDSDGHDSDGHDSIGHDSDAHDSDGHGWDGHGGWRHGHDNRD